MSCRLNRSVVSIIRLHSHSANRVTVGSNNSLNHHWTDTLSTAGFARGQTAYLQGGIALEHLALCEELLAETVVGGVAGHVLERAVYTTRTHKLVVALHVFQPFTRNGFRIHHARLELARLLTVEDRGFLDWSCHSKYVLNLNIQVQRYAFSAN